MKHYLINTLISSLLFLCSCEPDAPGEEECIFHPQRPCPGFSFSIVDAETYENLIGPGKLIDPDKVVITNTRGDTMYSIPRISYTEDWHFIGRFTPFQEITCFNQCLSDSAFSRYYYLNYGGEDTDTMEVHFPLNRNRGLPYFNGVKGWELEDKPPELADQAHWSSYWFLKRLQ